MHPSKKTKRTCITLGFTMFLIILNLFIPFSYANEWSPDTRLTWDPSLDLSPSITQANDERIWFVWHSFKIGTNPDILYKVYNGSSTLPWSPTKKLTTDPHKDQTPSITTTTEGNLWVVWTSNRDDNLEIYYKIYDGSSWSPDTRLTNHTSKDENPSVIQDKDGDIWIVWSSNRTGDPGEIFCSIYNGTEWSPDPIKLTTNEAKDWGPTITQAADESMWLVWVRDNNLYYKIFDQNWIIKKDDTPLTQDSYFNLNPSIIQAQDGTIWIAWDTDKFGPDTNIFVKNRTSEGLWSEEKITENNKNDVMPTIMQAEDGTIWIAWTSDRVSGNFDIYYKTDIPPQHSHDIAIISVTHNLNTTYIAKGSSISIEVVPQNQGVEPETFNVTVYANSTLIGLKNITLNAGQLMPVNFAWNTSDTALGTYTITAMADIVPGETDTADNNLVNGMVMVTMPSDVNGDRIVDIFDIGAISAHWYPGPPIGPLGYDANADVNDDDAVDIFDIGIVSAHWGES